MAPGDDDFVVDCVYSAVGVVDVSELVGDVGWGSDSDDEADCIYADV